MGKILAIFAVLLLLVLGVVYFAYHGKAPAKTTNLSTEKVTIDNHTFTVEVAKDQVSWAKGLSDRPSLPQDHGMLFVFPQADYVTFWMHRMEFPLDMIFINDKTIVTIAENAPKPPSIDQTPTQYFKPTSPADKVLEINAGLSSKYHFKVGDTVSISQ